MTDTSQFGAVFGSSRGTSAIVTHYDAHDLGPEHRDIRLILEQLEELASKNSPAPYLEAEEQTYMAQAAYCAGILTGPKAIEAEAFHDIDAKLSKLAKDYMHAPGKMFIDRAFQTAIMASQLKAYLPEKIYLALHREWWKLMDDPRAAKSPEDMVRIADFMDLGA